MKLESCLRKIWLIMASIFLRSNQPVRGWGWRQKEHSRILVFCCSSPRKMDSTNIFQSTIIQISNIYSWHHVFMIKVIAKENYHFPYKSRWRIGGCSIIAVKVLHLEGRMGQRMVDGWTHGGMDWSMNGPMDGWMDRLTNWPMEGWTGEWVQG